MFVAIRHRVLPLSSSPSVRIDVETREVSSLPLQRWFRSGHRVQPLEDLRRVGATARQRATARAVVDLECRTRRGRSSANVEAFSASHVYELAPGWSRV